MRHLSQVWTIYDRVNSPETKHTLFCLVYILCEFEKTLNKNFLNLCQSFKIVAIVLTEKQTRTKIIDLRRCICSVISIFFIPCLGFNWKLTFFFKWKKRKKARKINISSNVSLYIIKGRIKSVQCCIL